MGPTPAPQVVTTPGDFALNVAGNFDLEGRALERDFRARRRAFAEYGEQVEACAEKGHTDRNVIGAHENFRAVLLRRSDGGGILEDAGGGHGDLAGDVGSTDEYAVLFYHRLYVIKCSRNSDRERY